MSTTRIHIQPCAAGYEYRLGPSSTVHLARRDDVSSQLFDNVHALHCMLTGKRPYQAAYEDRLIRRIRAITAYRSGPRPDRFAPDRAPRAIDRATIREPICRFRFAS